ncbi:Glutamyl-tRNA(Gln) amidotransferase subunit C [Candidatus Rubidus massiliensis]|nr:MAG: glutamyl-tRNA amidotransferase [Chlamydia sp. 32-24]CDZ81027.1 Glutamyl-tRNA(Gln) amidotransferase subunit C [Candidatus Rubidus massiliensis]
MIEFNEETIKTLTNLSYIDCTEEEQKALLKDLKGIINHFENLSEIDTDNVKPCNHVLEDIHNVMRDDEVGKTLSSELLFMNAPSKIGGLFKVPTVIKQS